MSTPSQLMIDNCVTPNYKPEGLSEGALWATHSGELDFGGFKMKCHILSNGQRVFDADSVAEFFGGEITINPNDIP